MRSGRLPLLVDQGVVDGRRSGCTVSGNVLKEGHCGVNDRKQTRRHSSCALPPSQLAPFFQHLPYLLSLLPHSGDFPSTAPARCILHCARTNSQRTALRPNLLEGVQKKLDCSYVSLCALTDLVERFQARAGETILAPIPALRHFSQRVRRVPVDNMDAELYHHFPSGPLFSYHIRPSQLDRPGTSHVVRARSATAHGMGRVLSRICLHICM